MNLEVPKEWQELWLKVKQQLAKCAAKSRAQWETGKMFLAQKMEGGFTSILTQVGVSGPWIHPDCTDKCQGARASGGPGRGPEGPGGLGILDDLKITIFY